MLDELLVDDSGVMSPWDLKFIDSLAWQREGPDLAAEDPQGRPVGRWQPTTPQWKQLDRIWTEVFG